MLKGFPVGVVLMSFGSPATLEDVPSYLTSARGGRAAPDEVVAEFQRRYRLVGGSPLVGITQEQAAALESLLNDECGPGERYRVMVGMRNSPPWISDALTYLEASGVSRILAIILSPQYSPIIMGGYHRAIEGGCATLSRPIDVRVAGSWHTLPSFLDALARRVGEALDEYPPLQRKDVPVIMTAHSLPKNVVDQEPRYIDQLRETAMEVELRVGLEAGRTQFAYQSAGHTPAEWLRPDVKELFPALREAGHDNVLVVPVQFLADHLEILYDIDVAAKEEAEQVGICLSRIEMFNTMPEFIRVLADVVHSELSHE